jgi:heme-degrading monooxygenase HmoA
VSSKQFTYIWEYTIDPERRAEFLSAYKPDGDWARLMSRHPGYLGTKLLRDVDEDNRFLTVDYWTSMSDRDEFREKYASEFDQLDRACEQYTVAETFIGDFLVSGG